MTDSEPNELTGKLRAILLTVGGRAIRLSSREKWLRAIERGELTASSAVKTERIGEEVTACFARDIPELAGLLPPEADTEIALEPTFEPEPAEAPPAEVASTAGLRFDVVLGTIVPTSPASKPTPTPSVNPPKPPVMPVSPAAATTAKPVPPPAAPKAKASPPPPAAPVRKRGPGLGRWLLLALALFVVISLARSCGQSSGGNSLSLHAVREANVRDAPTTSGAVVGALSRGDAVKAEPVSGGDADNPWFKLKGGALDGRYVWGKALGKTPPPVLDLTIGANQRVRRSGPILATPGGGAEVGDLKARTSVFVVGRLASGWWEIRKGPVVGYVRPETFRAPAAAIEAPRPTRGAANNPPPRTARPAVVEAALPPELPY
jgi:hypothetical protein